MELQNRKNLQFRVSTALKSIIGKDLINDKYKLLLSESCNIIIKLYIRTIVQ